MANDAASLTAAIESLATQNGRYGIRRVTTFLKADGWRVNHKRVERIWRLEDLKGPARQRKRGRLLLNDGSCIRLRPEHRNHVWTYDFVHGRIKTARRSGR
jgi:putative transposase